MSRLIDLCKEKFSMCIKQNVTLYFQVLIPTMWSILHKVQLHNHWNQSDNGNTGQCQFQYSLEVRLLLIYITSGSITVRIRVSS